LDVKKQYEDYKKELLKENNINPAKEFEDIDKELESVDLNSKMIII
jgi:hypothetical protein